MPILKQRLKDVKRELEQLPFFLCFVFFVSARAYCFNFLFVSEQDFTFLKLITSFGYIKKSDGTFTHKKTPTYGVGIPKA